MDRYELCECVCSSFEGTGILHDKASEKYALSPYDSQADPRSQSQEGNAAVTSRRERCNERPTAKLFAFVLRGPAEARGVSA